MVGCWGLVGLDVSELALNRSTLYFISPGRLRFLGIVVEMYSKQAMFENSVLVHCSVLAAQLRVVVVHLLLLGD